MSLSVPPALLDKVREGSVEDAEFIECVRTSLPYAWELVSSLTERLHAGTDEFADNQIPPPDEEARGQLLRMLSSNAMRDSLERHFGVALAFQNCHRLAVFRPEAVDGPVHQEFISPLAQLRNQSPELVNC
jgi:hypothetical protein